MAGNVQFTTVPLVTFILSIMWRYFRFFLGLKVLTSDNSKQRKSPICRKM